MRKIFIPLLSIMSLGLMLLTVSCTDSLEETNINPNSPSMSDITSFGLFNNANKALMNASRGDFSSGRIALPWMQYSAQKNYTEEDRFQYRVETGNSFFTDHYLVAQDFKTIIDLNTNPATAAANSAYGNTDNQIAAARIMLAYTFCQLTDAFGDIPYYSYGNSDPDFQALALDRGILKPKYASQEKIYTDLMKELKEASEMIVLGEKVLKKALDKAKWEPETIDYIITVSCTGIMIPSLDAYLINKLNLRQDIVRLPVTEMGCVGGVSGIIYAKNFLKANPNKRAVVIAVESPTATFQLDDYSMANIVSAAIFGDGAACVLLSSYENEVGPTIVDEAMYHFYDKENMMGFELTNKGLKMILDIEVSDTIEEHFPAIIHPFLERNNLKIEDIDHLIFHPGGKKIVNLVEGLFSDLGKNIDDTKEVLRLYGNMSSATVLYVLERIMANKPKDGDKGVMLCFGPGFTAQRLLLEW